MRSANSVEEAGQFWNREGMRGYFNNTARATFVPTRVSILTK